MLVCIDRKQVRIYLLLRISTEPENSEMDSWQRPSGSRSLGGSIQVIEDEESHSRSFRDRDPCAVIGFNRAL